MKKFFLCLFCIIFSSAVGQIQTDDRPYSFENVVEEQSLFRNFKIVVPDKKIDVALAEDSIDRKIGRPPRFGLMKETDFNMKNSGTWIDLSNGGKLWRLRIKSPSAKSINLLYDAFHLPIGGILHIYNKKKSHIIGGFTERNNKGTIEDPGKFATGLVYGDEVTLEYYHPEDVKREEAIISIKGVIHGYKYIKLLENYAENGADETGFEDSGSCQVNINCTEGDNWQDEKKGVAMLLINSGTRWCTGSLINNTNQDFTPFFLTADHCVEEDNLDAQGNTDASQWIFYWNYESPNCNNGTTEPAISSTAGANLRANRSDTDFALFELIESPVDANYDVYFNGWDRTTTPSQGGAGIHHPAGDIKKIATHDMVPGPGQVYNTNTHWRVMWKATVNGFSITEGGSSGSPLFMNNGRIIGQLHGGSNINCSYPAQDPGEYGRLHVSWNGSNAQRRLRDWLDPLATNSNFLDGIYPVLCDPQISGPSSLCTTASYTIEDLQTGATVNWSTSGEISVPPNSTGNTVMVTSIGNGNGTLIAALSNSCTNSLTKTIKTGTPIITAESYSYNNSSNYSISPYYSVPNNAVSEIPAYVEAIFSFEGATFSSAQILNQSDNSITWGGGFGSDNLLLNFDFYQPDQWIVFQISAISACGTSTYDVAFYSPESRGGYMVYPNPADTELTVAYTEVVQKKGNLEKLQSPEEESQIFEIMLTDFNGNILISRRSKKSDKELKLNTQNFPEGIYLLQINDKDQSITKKIIISH